MDIGTVVADRYELVGLLGRGGMGEVWKGFDRNLDRHVAIKFIRNDVFADDDRLVQAEKRLRREARVTARIQHPGVPVIYDVGSHEGQLFLVMQLVEGCTVDDLIAEEERLPVAWAAAITAQVCAVLTVAHGESLIHRDLKPNNLMLSPDGTVKVLDFGIVAVLDPATETTKITRMGELLGVAAYLAPEYAIGSEPSPQGDLYSIGCILHEMLTGSRVFEAAHTVAELTRHYHDPPPPLRSLRADVPEGVEELVLSLLAKLPEQRPASAAEVYERLLPYVEALPALPGATMAAPFPDPLRMYAIVVGRIAETALVGPSVPESTVRRELNPHVGHVTEGEIKSIRDQAADLVVEGRYAQAIELMRAMVPSAIAEYGNIHQVVLALRMDLATTLFMNRNFQEAGSEFAALADGISRQAGPDHPRVLECRHQQAVCLVGLGRTQDGLARLQELLPAFERVYSPTSAQTLSLRHQIGRLLAITGKVDIAEPLLARVLVEMRNLQGGRHPETEEVRELLAHMVQLHR